MIVRRESSNIDYHAPFDQGLKLDFIVAPANPEEAP